MFLGLIFIVTGLIALMLLERIFPDQELKRVPGWWMRVITINICQLFIVIMASYTWERWLLSGIAGNPQTSVFHLKDYLGSVGGGLIAYLINTWIFYWFHRARHEIYCFWVLFHQVHHSASRIEAITSFYKHPLEIMVDSVLMTILLYPILGLGSESSIWLSIFSAYGEYFYHMNIKTPQWLGYFFQRPESHRIHHLRNKRLNCKNYSDFPIWDILGDTFQNPEDDSRNLPTGFVEEKELKFTEMMLYQDVLQPTRSWYSDIGMREFFSVLLLIIGLLQPIGYLFDRPSIRGLGIVSNASPLPLVFSAYNGVDTFATSFEVTLYSQEPFAFESVNITKSLYSKIDGPYNRRNIFGVLFSHGPFFTNPQLIRLRDELLRYAICEDRLNLKETVSFNYTINSAVIVIKWNSQNRRFMIGVDCTATNI